MRTKELTKTAVMAALVFVAIYVLKIPGPNGYSHLGDCMILISVLLLGGRKGAWAGGIGAALADLLGGYMQWVLPTFLIKAFMALIMGYVINNDTRTSGTDSFRSCTDFYIRGCFGHHWHFTKSKGDVDI